ncbi:MAG: hypothetical protein L0Y79_12520 [Chlorobi bacterium]|nr:hypothetical protein [Chlorobiota bacterium]MCI0716828.1 hypothetical protein [Chlorobiota bacterium]
MRYILAILILFSAKLTIAQVYPFEFKITPDYSKKVITTQDNIPKSIGRYSVTPVSSPTIISNFISDIIVIANPNSDTIWFGTGKGIARTTNYGISFENYYGTPPFNEDDVSGIAVYKNFVVVATAYSQEVNEEFVPTGTGIKVSSDYGVTWTSYPQPKEPLDSASGTFIRYGNNQIPALAIVVDEQNLSYDVLITRKNLTSDSIVIWIASWAGGFRKSTDYGATFQRIVTPPDNLDSVYPGGTYTFRYDPLINGNHKGFSLAALNDSVIFAGSSAGINKSTDWGVSWKKYRYHNTGSGSGISGNFVVGLKFQRYANREILWAATNPGEGESNNSGQFSAVSFTTDAGESWGNTLEEGLFSHNLGFKDSIVYAATDNGIWRAYFTPPSFRWSKPSIIYDESIRDQVRTNLFYAVNSQGDSVWVGSGDGLARTTDTLTSPWVSKWKIFRAYQNFATIQETYAAPNPFSPDDEVCRIYFKTGKPSATVTIKIFDFAMFPVRTVIQNASRSSTDVLWAAWDGKRDDGSQVANGVYFYRLEIDKDERVWGKILVLQ